MHECRLKILLGALMLFAATLPTFAGDPKAVASLKAAGITVTTLPGGGSRVSVASDKINDNLWTQLEALGDLKMFGVKDKSFDNAAIARLSKISTVESIVIYNPGFDDAAMAVLANLPNLRTINIDHGVGLSGTGLAALAGTKLEMINIGGSHIDDHGMEAIGKLTQLTDCTLRHIRISGVGFANVARLTHLKKFMHSASFHPNMAGSDLRALSGLNELQELTLGEMVMTYDDGLVYLKPLTQLKKLTLMTCGISEADLAKLKADHPDTKITFIPADEKSVKTYNEGVAKLKAAAGEKK